MKTEKTTLSTCIDELQASGRYFFDRQILKKKLLKNSIGFDLALHRLIKKERVAKVRNNFYIIIPLEYRSMGCLPATWFIDQLMGFMRVDYYVALLSAAEYFGATHQSVMRFQVMTNRPMRQIRVGKIHIEFHYRKDIPMKLTEKIKTETGSINISSPEVTALDLIKYVKESGYINHVATVLNEIMGKLSMKKLLAYLENYSTKTTLVQRLGYLLDYLEWNENTTPLLQWLKLNKKKLNYEPLVTTNKVPILQKNKRWRILVNENIEID